MTRTTANEEAHIHVQDDFSERASFWMDKNSKLINGLLIAVVLLVLGWTVYKWFRQGAIEKANQGYGMVLQQFTTAVNEQDETKRRDALNGAITAAESVIRDYPNQQVSRYAQLLLGNAHYKLASMQSGEAGRPAMKNARAAYEKVVNSAKTPLEKAAGHLGLGNVLQDEMFINNDPAMAKQVEDAYKQASDEAKGTYLEAEAKMNLARLYEGSLRNDDARKLYETVAAENQITPSKETADVKAIEVEGGRTLTPEQIMEIQSFSRISYAEAAQSALARLAGATTSTATALAPAQ